MSSFSAFLQWFKDYYANEYLDIDREFKNKCIEEVLSNNAKYITKQMVLNFDGCSMCGCCCVNQYCPHVDTNGLCTRHDNPISEMCKEYPWGGDMGIAPLLLYCDYQVRFFIQYFNELFDEILKEGVIYE